MLAFATFFPCLLFCLLLLVFFFGFRARIGYRKGREEREKEGKGEMDWEGTQ
jgi:hypothetical protein